MSDFKIRIHLATPLFEKTNISKHPIMLDALLARIKLGRQGISKTPAELNPDNLVFAELPIERVGKCYLCSGSFLPPSSYAKVDAFAGRPANTKAIRLVSKEFLSTGVIGNSSITRYYSVAVEHVDFHVRAVDGREQELFDLLKDVKLYGLGAKTGIGAGQISGIEAIPEKGTDLCFRTEDGFPTRALPVELFKGKISGKASVGMSTYFAPYWMARNKVLCYLPKPEQYSPLPSISDGVFSDIEKELEAEKKALEEKKNKKRKKKAPFLFSVAN